MLRYSANPRGAAKNWIFKARKVRQLRDDYPHFPFVSHEEFVESPTSINRILDVPYREVSLKGKRASGLTRITSTYCRSIGFLRQDDVVAATDILENARGELEYFDYGLAGPRFLADAQERNSAEFSVGLARRESWDQRQTSTAKD